MHMEEVIASYQSEVAEMKQTLHKKTISEESFENDSHRLKFYTSKMCKFLHSFNPWYFYFRNT